MIILDHSFDNVIIVKIILYKKSLSGSNKSFHYPTESDIFQSIQMAIHVANISN